MSLLRRALALWAVGLALWLALATAFPSNPVLRALARVGCTDHPAFEVQQATGVQVLSVEADSCPGIPAEEAVRRMALAAWTASPYSVDVVSATVSRTVSGRALNLVLRADELRAATGTSLEGLPRAESRVGPATRVTTVAETAVPALVSAVALVVVARLLRSTRTTTLCPALVFSRRR